MIALSIAAGSRAWRHQGMMAAAWILLFGFVNMAAGECEEEVRLRPPSIHFNCPLGQYPVQSDALFISGMVSGATGIDRLEFNGKPVSLGSGGTFGFIADATPGFHRFVLKAWDAWQAASERVVEVTTEAEAVFRPEFRLRLLALRSPEGRAGYEGDFLEACLLEALHESGRFHLLERSNLKDILQEHELARMDLVSTDALLQLGRLLLAEQVFSFRIDERDDMMTIMCQLVDVGSGRVVWSSEYRCGSPDDLDELEKLGRGVALDVKCLTRARQSLVLDSSDWPKVLVEGGLEQGIHQGIKSCLLDAEGQVFIGFADSVFDGFSQFLFDEEAICPAAGDPVWLIGCPAGGR